VASFKLLELTEAVAGEVCLFDAVGIDNLLLNAAAQVDCQGCVAPNVKRAIITGV